MVLSGPGLTPLGAVQQILKPNRSLPAFLAGFFPAAMRRALPVYIPIYFLPALAVHRHRVFLEPGKLLGKVRGPILFWRARAKKKTGTQVAMFFWSRVGG